MQDLCVCCGNVVPEGRQVCPTCEADPLISRGQNKKVKDESIDDTLMDSTLKGHYTDHHNKTMQMSKQWNC